MISIHVETERWVTREIDPDDDWDQGSSDGSITGVAAVYREEGSDRGFRGMGWGDGNYDIDAQPGDIVYTVIAKYGTGNTFGSEGCQISVMDVFTNSKDAEKLYYGLKDVSDYQVTVEGRDYYIPWVGYFEWIQSLDIYTLVVQTDYSYLYD